MRVLKFDNFSKIYEERDLESLTEAEVAALQEEAKDILLQIGVLFFNTYGYLLGLTKDYPDTIVDFQTVISADADGKIDAMKKIAAKLSNAVREEFKKDGLDKLWLDAANKSADAYGALIQQFKDNKEAQDEASSILNKKITSYVEGLKKSKEEIKKESFEFLGYDQIFEGFFTTKKGSVNNLIKQGVVVDSLLKAESENKDITSDVQKLQTELDSILSNLAKLSRSKKDEIDEKELEKIALRLTQMPVELNTKKEQLAKSNKAFGDASSLFVRALQAANKALAKEKEVKDKLASEQKKETDAKTESALKIKRNITKEEVGKEKNEDVTKFQELVLTKFKNNPDVNSTDLFKKFVKFGADGMFGGTTAGIIKALKAGFGLKDQSTDITQELIDELSAHEVKESFNVVKNFDTFNKLNEEFDVAAFKTASMGGTPSVSDSSKTVAPKIVSVGNAVEVEAGPNTQDKIEKAVEKVLSEKEKESLLVQLEKLGAKRLDGAKDGAIAASSALRFYPNGVFWRPSTRKTGKLPKDLSKGKDTIIIDEFGNEVKLGDTMKSWLGPLSKIYKDLYADIHGTAVRNKKLYTETLSKLTPHQVEMLARNYVKAEGEGLLAALDSEWTNTAEIRAFSRKYADSLEKHNKKK
jgi:hypothetical protein